MTTWAHGIHAISLFVEDLEASKDFYRKAFEQSTVFEDDSSAVFAFGPTLINLLAVGEAGTLIEPAPVGGPEAGARFQLTVQVDDVDAVCARLASIGVELLNGPTNRPWGVRTACFQDPSGHKWEIAES